MHRSRALLLSILVATCFAPGSAQTLELTFRARVEAQRAIERVYYAHQIGASRPFDQAVPQALLERKVETYLKQSVALERFWGTPVTAAVLQSEWNRIALSSRFPERLEEIYAALGRDPVLIQETFVRSVLVDRLSRNFFKTDQRIHGESRREIEALRERLESGALRVASEDPRRTVWDLLRGGDDLARPPSSGIAEPRGRTRDRNVDPAEFQRWRDSAPSRIGEIGEIKDEADAWSIRIVLGEGDGWIRIAGYAVPKRAWDDWWREASGDWDEQRIAAVARPLRVVTTKSSMSLAFPETTTSSCVPADTWENGILDAAPRPAAYHAAVWTGSLMVVWGGTREETPMGLGARYDPLTDTWSPTSTTGAPSLRNSATAVWTGQQMIIWGGSPVSNGGSPLSTGGRYDPVSDSWQPTSISGAPQARMGHTAVWTGMLMVIWGGAGQVGLLPNGGRYNPANDTWSPVSTVGQPSARAGHTAIWTGSRMVVWGGSDNFSLNTGGLYDPVADNWVGTTTLNNAPSTRYYHSAIWTGSRMFVWGGYNGILYLDTGKSYDPVGNTWSDISSANAPSPRAGHTAISTGSRMVVWGGGGPTFNQLNTGGVYNPSNDTWSATSTVNAPLARSRHTAVWTGDRMIVWGGFLGQDNGTNTGGRYDPATDTWTPTWTTGEVERSSYTAVWTGNEMILWGGVGVPGNMNTGSRYSPLSNSWTPTTTSGAPDPRNSHSAVWTGNEMIVWGGWSDDTNPNTGSRYNPVLDAWSPMTAPNPPPGRSLATAIWTGTEMIVWGGYLGNPAPSPGPTVDTGGRYNPTTETWVATSPGPVRRGSHSAVWTGSRMIVWGGQSTTGPQDTGAQYDPGSNIWTPTSTVDAPSARLRHTAVWTGSRMIVWGGHANGGILLNTGAQYDPTHNSWAPVSTVGAPSAREWHSTVWMGSRMVVWGGNGVGSTGIGSLNTGGRYDPLADSWSATSLLGAPSPRYLHTAIAAGNFMIVWGGTNIYDPYADLSSGGRYVVSAIDQGVDSDGDGFSVCTDCDDSVASIHPGAPEICDGLDDDCNGVIEDDFDLDGDGYSRCAPDCNDSDPGVWDYLVELPDLNVAPGFPTIVSWLDLGPLIGPAIDYDVVSGSVGPSTGINFAAGACVQSGSSAPNYSDSGPNPSPGAGRWYLARARNSCDTGTYGASSVGTERTLPNCP